MAAASPAPTGPSGWSATPGPSSANQPKWSATAGPAEAVAAQAGSPTAAAPASGARPGPAGSAPAATPDALDQLNPTGSLSAVAAAAAAGMPATPPATASSPSMPGGPPAQDLGGLPPAVAAASEPASSGDRMGATPGARAHRPRQRSPMRWNVRAGPCPTWWPARSVRRRRPPVRRPADPASRRPRLRCRPPVPPRPGRA